MTGGRSQRQTGDLWPWNPCGALSLVPPSKPKSNCWVLRRLCSLLLSSQSPPQSRHLTEQTMCLSHLAELLWLPEIPGLCLSPGACIEACVPLCCLTGIHFFSLSTGRAKHWVYVATLSVRIEWVMLQKQTSPKVQLPERCKSRFLTHAPSALGCVSSFQSLRKPDWWRPILSPDSHHSRWEPVWHITHWLFKVSS